MLNQIAPWLAPSANWLWLFVVAWVIHAIEEVKDLGAGIKRSSLQFGALVVISTLLLALGVLLARSFGYPQLFGVMLATAFCLNALSHLITSLRRRRYNPGVITGVLIFLPLGMTVLFKFSHHMGGRRYLTGMLVGVLIQAVATLLRL